MTYTLYKQADDKHRIYRFDENNLEAFVEGFIDGEWRTLKGNPYTGKEMLDDIKQRNYKNYIDTKVFEITKEDAFLESI